MNRVFKLLSTSLRRKAIQAIVMVSLFLQHRDLSADNRNKAIFNLPPEQIQDLAPMSDRWLGTSTTIENFSFVGKNSIVMFGYTSCATMCPLMMQNIGSALKQLKQKSPRIMDRLQVVFVSLDPEHDTKVVLKRYLQSFDPDLVGISAAEDQLNEFYKILVGKARSVHPADHASLLYVVDQNGRYTSFTDSQTTRLNLAKRIEQISLFNSKSEEQNAKGN